MLGSFVKLVAVAAHSEPPKLEHELRIKEFTRLLSSRCGESTVLLVGGYWGFMKTLVDEALTAGLKVVIFPPIEKEYVDFPEKAVVIRSGLSYRLRSVMMVRSSDALVVLGGASGTMQELVTAYTEGKPVFLLMSGLATDRAASLAPYLDERRIAEIRVYTEVQTLIEELCDYLFKTRHGHGENVKLG